MASVSEFPFIDPGSPPKGPDVPSAPSVEEKVDLWVGMACSVAIEGHLELPSRPEGLREVARSGQAEDEKALGDNLRAWESIDTDTLITKEILQGLNHLVRGEQDPKRGAWRTIPVYIKTVKQRAFFTGDPDDPIEFRYVSEVAYEPPAANLVPGLMEEYLEGVKRWGDHPLAPWWAHLMLTLIHPWADGNGRTSRLVEAHLFRRRGASAPWASTRNNWPNRPLYYEALNETRGRNDPKVFYLHQNEMRADPAPIRYNRNPPSPGAAHTRTRPAPAPEPPKPAFEIDVEREKALNLLFAARNLPPDQRDVIMGRYWNALWEE